MHLDHKSYRIFLCTCARLFSKRANFTNYKLF
uniref:Uncharacterized protein n=1 Tax=Arundo donax TaxID=35708 RepID=A0A0A9C164_ARUDO